MSGVSERFPDISTRRRPSGSATPHSSLNCRLQNYTKFANGSWRGTQEVENAKLGASLAAAGSPRPIFPYVAFYAPQAWYGAQARFNDPEPQWQDMWLKDSQGAFASAIASDHTRCCPGEDEGAQYTQYSWRRLYDWRKASARRYLTEDVIKFVLDDPQVRTVSIFGLLALFLRLSLLTLSLSLVCLLALPPPSIPILPALRIRVKRPILCAAYLCGMPGGRSVLRRHQRCGRTGDAVWLPGLPVPLRELVGN